MPKKSLATTWYCHTLEQLQSDESRARGAHPDDGLWPPSPVHQTEFDGVTLELAPDGRYVIRGPSIEISSGTWSEDGGGLALVEDADQPRYFEQLRRVDASAKGIRLEFTLVPDAHDGLDVMALELRSKPPKPPKPLAALTPASVVEAIVAGKWKSRQQAKLDELSEDQRRAIHRAGWDALVRGTFGVDPSAATHYEQIDFLVAGAQLGAPTHHHLAHAMRALDDQGRNALSNAIAMAIVALPASADDAIVADAMSAPWLEIMAFYRFLGGVARAFDRPLFPQPAFDEACRAYLARPATIFGAGLDDAVQLFEGRAELAGVLLRHYGSGAIGRVRDAIAARGAEASARAAAIEALAALEPKGAAIVNDTDANTRRLGALAGAVMFRGAEALPPQVLASLAHGGKGYSRFTTADADKALLRASIESLPEDQRALVTATFWL